MKKLIEAINKHSHPATIAKIVYGLRDEGIITKREFELLKAIYSAYIK